MTESEVKIQAYSKKELANLYNRSVHVLNIWLCPFQEKVGEYKGKSYTIKQVQIIFDCLGKP